MKITNEVIVERIANLDSNVREGFAGIHKRQDTANHGIQKNTEFRVRTTASFMTIKFIIGVLGAGNILLLLKLFL